MGLASSVCVEWIVAVTAAAGTAAMCHYPVYQRFYVNDHHSKSMANVHIQKDNHKIIPAFHTEDLGDKAVYCHCWRSKESPFSDGVHMKPNEETGHGVGPLITKREETETDSSDAANPLVCTDEVA
ncbi:CDGSH iron-sulfur domain-containing protein 1-like [Molossus nigricans]